MQLLIVEDQEAMRTTLRDFLASSFPELRILDAGTGADALATSRRERPQLVLVDIGLPDTDGFELTRQLRAFSPAPAVIVVSLSSGPEYLARARAAGACAFVAKDVLKSDLVPAVAWALGITSPALRG